MKDVQNNMGVHIFMLIETFSVRLGSATSSEKFLTKFNDVGKGVWDAWDEHLENQCQGNISISAHCIIH
jgi:hypothetical protein